MVHPVSEKSNVCRSKTDQDGGDEGPQPGGPAGRGSEVAPETKTSRVGSVWGEDEPRGQPGTERKHFVGLKKSGTGDEETPRHRPGPRGKGSDKAPAQTLPSCGDDVKLIVVVVLGTPWTRHPGWGTTMTLPPPERQARGRSRSLDRRFTTNVLKGHRRPCLTVWEPPKFDVCK